MIGQLKRPPSLKTVYVSESVKEIYGYPAQKFIEENNFWLNHCVHKDDRDKVAKEWNEGSGEYVKQVLCRIVRLAGAIRWIECFSSKIIDDYVVYIEKNVSKRITKIESVKTDVKKEMAEELLKNDVDREIIFNITGVRF